MSETPNDNVVLRKIGGIAAVLENADTDDNEDSEDLPVDEGNMPRSQPSSEQTMEALPLNQMIFIGHSAV